MADFGQLKKNRKRNANKLREKIEEQKSGGTNRDKRFWKPSRNKTGYGTATIRFLMTPPNEEDAYVRVFDHGFKNNTTGKWYIEKSLTTIGQDDPVGEINRQDWNTDTKKGKALASSRKRRLKYVTNILVIDDPVEPENNGKVFLYEFGKQIFDIFDNALNPKYEGDKSFIPNDFWEGADFKIKIKPKTIVRDDGSKVDIFSYEDSEFLECSELYDGDEDKLKEIWESEHSLAEFVDPEQFKPYDVLKKRLKEVLGRDALNYEIFNGSAQLAAEGFVDDSDDDANVGRQETAEDLQKAGSFEEDDTPPWNDEEDDDHDLGDLDDDDQEALNMFKDLNEED